MVFPVAGGTLVEGPHRAPDLCFRSCVCEGASRVRIRWLYLFLAPLLLCCVVNLYQVTGSDDAEPSLVEVATSFPWVDYPVRVNYSLSSSSFVYGSASWPWGRHALGSDSFFLYYERGLLDSLAVLVRSLKSRDRDVYIVLDTDPPAENCTFLDLWYDEGLWLDLVTYLDDGVGSLSTLGVDGFVLGDEWPRGLNREEVRVHSLAKHNETYHKETGLWMRSEPLIGDKFMLAEWFYERSIQAWNRIAWEIRRRHPDTHLGTNIDLAWQPDLTGSDVAHWKPYHWWLQVDLAPYDFVVTHYFTRINHQESGNTTFPEPNYVDLPSLARLEEALEKLLGQDPGETTGLKVFLLLGAHCAYPYVTTPMQMIHEWNLAMKYSHRLAGVGWFIFDLWISNDGESIESISIADTTIQVPMKMDRLLTLRALLESPFHSSNVARVSGPDPPGLEVVWKKSFWHSDETVTGIVRDDAGGYVIVGTQQGPDTGYLVVPYLLRIDTIGNLVWSKSFLSNSSDDLATCVVMDDHGGFIVAGTRDSRAVFVMKVDDAGVRIWERTYPVEGGFPQMVATGEGGYVLASGSTLICIDDDGDQTWHKDLGPHKEAGSIIETAGGDLVVAGRGEETAYIMKIDSAGNEIWDKEWGDWWPLDIVRTQDGFVVAGGKGQLGDSWSWWEKTHLVRIDGDGNKVWERTLDYWTDEWYGRFVVCDVRDGFVVTWGEGVLLVNGEGETIWETSYCGEGRFGPGGMVGSGDGGVVIAGQLGNPGWEGDRGDIQVIKLDSCGSWVWDRIHGDEMCVSSVVSSGDCGYVVAGSTQSFDVGLRDAYLLKLGGEGDLAWERTYGSPGWESAQAVVLCEDGGFALAGWSMPLGGESRDLYVVRVDQKGERVWQRTYDVGGWEEAGCVVETGDGGLLVCGTVTYESDGSDAYLLRVDKDGYRVWEKVCDLRHWDHAHCVIRTHDGFVALGETFPSDGDSDILVMKVDEYGDTIWRKTYGAGGADSARIAVKTNDGCLVIGGHTEREGHEGPYLLKIDHDGNVIWERLLQWEGDTVRGITRSPDSGFWIFGRGGSMLKVDAHWEHVWDTSWEPVGSEAAIASSEDGSYVLVGNLYDGIQVVKLREPASELSAIGALALFASLSLIRLFEYNPMHCRTNGSSRHRLTS